MLLSVFRKRDHLFIKLIEDCKQARDSREHMCFLLMDISKAVDCYYVNHEYMVYLHMPVN